MICAKVTLQLVTSAVGEAFHKCGSDDTNNGYNLGGLTWDPCFGVTQA